VSFIQRLQNHIKASLLKTLLVTALFIFVYQIYNVEIIRSSIEDRAFDLVNIAYLNDTSDSVEAPIVNVLKIDRYALKENNLLNQNGFINYGYIYPRDKVAVILKKINALPLNKQPKILFLDLDFSFTSSSYGMQLTEEDKLLLKVLQKEHNYTLLLPKTSDFNFIEHSDDVNIQKQIKNGKMQFVSVSFTVNQDGLSRRYLPYQIFDNKKYWHAAIRIWQLTRNYSNEILKKFKFQDIIDNRIIYKEKYNQGIDVKKDGYEIYRAKSYWDNLYLYSENYPFSSMAMSNSIVMIGIDHSESQDFFSVNAMYAKVSGIEMHTNALETIYKHDGPLKKIPLWVGVVIIFFIFLIVDLMLELVFERVGISSKEIIFISALLLSSLLFFGISVLLLKVFNLWFNWLIPFILFELYEVIEITLYYYKKYKERKRRI
jgi:CHASE2 domain-containing sensor protein